MKKGQGQEEEGDNEASSGKREVDSVFNANQHWTKDLARFLEEGSAKNQGHDGSPENPEAEPSTMSHEQINLAYELCRERVPFAAIGQLMGVSEGSVNPFELKKILMEAEVFIAESVNAQEESIHDQTSFQANETEFQVYNRDRWETAVEETTADEIPNEEEAAAPNIFVPIVPTLESDFVRALRHSKAGSRPYHKTGDILRVINKKNQRDLNDQYFELLPLKPPGEAGKALVRDFEPADQAAVEAVGREASSGKEKDSFRCAVEWED